jgi:serine-type D-Ala-D-Ala carboxypeptidase/endopeptidase (penicillin-binding protein 4)
MTRKLSLLIIMIFPCILSGQEKSLSALLADSSMSHSSVSVSIIDAGTGNPVLEYNAEKSLTPASVMKLFTSAAALELLGPDYKFYTIIGYTGNLDKNSGILKGNIVIKGGGDPALGSEYFRDHYRGFVREWVNEIKKTGIKRITGKVIADDSYYDFQPVPAKWLWEDTGNYYGAGVFGLSVFDNTYDIHMRSFGDSTLPVITGILPAEVKPDLVNRLIANDADENGYVFAVPYDKNTWLNGSVPHGIEDYILKASIPDPPLLIATILANKLDSAGIFTKNKPSTIRIENSKTIQDITLITETESPPLSDIVEVLNHESVNLFAEHLTKELGKVYKNRGSTFAGIETISSFLKDSAGISPDGIFMEDGSGLSPMDAVSSHDVTRLLYYMKNNGRYFSEYYSSLPEAGKEGTLKTHFRDPVFDGSMRAKSGSMTRVRSYAGYLKAISGKDLIFCIIFDNFSGPSGEVVLKIEKILKETIQNN